MSSRNAGSSSSRKQYAVRELRSKASTSDDFKFNSQLRARDSVTAKKHVLFLPASQPYALKLYSDPASIDFPSSPSSDYKSKVPDTFYPDLLVQFVDDFSQGSICREEGYTLYRALTVVQDAVADIMDGPKAKTKEAVVAMFKNPKSYYRIFWHKTRCCPLFALRFICLLCDFCEKVLTKAEYTSKVYNEDSRRGLGVDKALRLKIRALKGPSHNVASLAIPLPLDPSTYEGQLLITIAQSGAASQVLRHPVTDLILLPDPSGVEDLPPASPLLNAVEDDDFGMEASPTAGFEDEDDGETEVSEDIEVEDIFKAPKGKGKAKASLELPIRHSPRVKPSKVSSAKVGPPVASRPAPKPSKHARDTSSPVADASFFHRKYENLCPRRQDSGASDKTSKETPPPQVTDPSSATTTKGSKSAVAETHEPAEESEASLVHNDLDTSTHHALFLTNPNFQVKTAFADLVEQDSGVKRRPEMQILRSSPWTLDDELKELGAFLTTGGVSFSLENLGRFGHLVSRRMVHEDSDMAVSDPDLAPSLDCVSCQVRGLTCVAGSRLGGPCQGCTQSHRTCPSALHLELQSDLLQDLPKSVQSLPGGYSLALTRFQAGLDRYFRAQELAQEMFNLAGYNLANLVRDLKVSGLDANVVLTAWAKEHPNEKLGYDDATLFATFFNWNSSCNLSAYLEKPEDIEKFQQFLKDHKLDLPSVPSTSGEATSDPGEPPVEEPKRTYSAMHASNWKSDAEAAAKPDEPTTLVPDEQKP
ncbi:hypothetical protein C8R42DRAFT_728279 [Lentinula raphanica]|nr:hypothetical protein C8R42DRAFT_728279 [Lentinula raphanica]